MSGRSLLDRLLNGVEIQWMEVGKLIPPQRGRRLVKSQLDEVGSFAVYQNSMKPLGYYKESNAPAGATFVIVAGAAGEVGFSDVAFWAADDVYFFPTTNAVNNKYLYHSLLVRQHEISSQVRRASVPRLSIAAVEKLEIPIPCPENRKRSLEIQAEIVRLLDAFTELTANLTAELVAERAARKKQYNYYRDQLLRGERWDEWKTIGELAENLDTMRRPITSALREPGDIPYYGASGIVDYVKDFIFDCDLLLVSEDGANLLVRNTPIAFSVSGKSWVNNHAHVLKFETYAERKYVECYLNSIDLAPHISGAAQPKLNKKNLESIRVPNPPLEEKKRVVNVLDKFDDLTRSITESLPREIELRQRQFEYYRELLLSFPKSEAVEA